MPINARRKGYRGEYNLVKLLRELGYEAGRVPLSGSTEGYKGDVYLRVGDTQILFEVKTRKALPSLYKPALPYLYKGNIAVVSLTDFLQNPAILYEIRRHPYKPPAYLREYLKQAKKEHAYLVVKANRKPYLLIGRPQDLLLLAKLLGKGD